MHMLEVSLLRWVAMAALGLILIVAGLKEAHIGMGAVIARQPVAVLILDKITDLAVLLDREPPSPPTDLVAGTAPFVQKVQSYITYDHVTKHSTAPFDSTGGDLIVVYATTHGKLAFTPSDTFGNTWIPLVAPTDFSHGDDLRSGVWYAKSPKTGPDHVFTIDLSSPHSLVISLFVIRGSDRLDPVDEVSAIGDDAGTPTAVVQSPVITTRHSDDLLIGFGKPRWSEDYHAGDGFALQPAASSDFLAAETSLASIPGRYSATFRMTGQSNWQSAVVAVKPGAMSGAQPVTLSWRPSHDFVGVKTYTVERCAGPDCNHFTQVGTSTDTSFVDRADLRAGRYSYRVIAINAAGRRSLSSNVVTISLPELDSSATDRPSVSRNASSDGSTSISVAESPAEHGGRSRSSGTP
jgi:hypothetical protein